MERVLIQPGSVGFLEKGKGRKFDGNCRDFESNQLSRTFLFVFKSNNC
jgi:hypothetical protein